jgi:hypothetical protein
MATPEERSNEAIIRRHKTEQLFYGWFDDAAQEEPTYSPPLGGPCPLCGKTMVIGSEDIKTVSLMFLGPIYAKRSYFYRAHKTCGETATADGFIFDMIKHNGD